MALKDWVSKLLGFRATSVSIITLVLYGSVFTAVLVTDQTPGIPKNLLGLSLDEAYDDLHRVSHQCYSQDCVTYAHSFQITRWPHPYNSHANDDVHHYLMDRLDPIVASQSYIKLYEDLTSNVSYVTSRGPVYFEGKNIFIKVDGTDASSLERGAVLFSAHYDSVSTAPGATDNGMGVVTLIQMVKYLADPERRPRRTAIFFFNNGEEDGLNGAHTFFEHPWSNMATSFINLEGAAAGGYVNDS